MRESSGTEQAWPVTCPVPALSLAKQIQFTGLPARICRVGYGERPKAALKVSEMMAAGEIVGPVSFTRDHFNAGGASTLARERIERVLNADTGLGVLRYEDAGYKLALKARERLKLGVGTYFAARAPGARA